MSKNRDPRPVQPKRRAVLQGAAALAGAAGLSSLGFPAISLAQNKPIRIGMPTILSGRVAMLGQASSNAAIMEVEKFNAIGGAAARSRAGRTRTHYLRRLRDFGGCRSIVGGLCSP